MRDERFCGYAEDGPCIWAPARTAAGIILPTWQDGTHALRHHYASALLDAGESIKALSEYLGHHG